VTETIDLTVNLGDISSTASFTITFKNPCIDTDFLSVEKVAPFDFSYDLYSGDATW
jgi:hypothetical protein